MCKRQNKNLLCINIIIFKLKNVLTHPSAQEKWRFTRDLYVNVCCSFIHNHQKPESSKCPSTNKQIVVIHIMECYSAIKMNKLLNTACFIMLNERRNNHMTISTYIIFWKNKTKRIVIISVVATGWGKEIDFKKPWGNFIG